MFARKKNYPTFRSKKRMEIERITDKKHPRTPERTPDQLRLTRRTVVFKGLAVTSFAALTGRLWQLQVRDHQVSVDAQQTFSQSSFPLPAARGLIYDRDRKILADNMKSWSVSIIPANLPSADTDDGALQRRAIFTTLANQLQMLDVIILRPPKMPTERESREEIYQRLAAAIGIDIDAVRFPVEKQMAQANPQRAVMVPEGKQTLSPQQLDTARALANEFPKDIMSVINPIEYQVDIFGEWRPYTPRVIKTDVDKGVALGIEANRLYLPGVQIDDQALSRNYRVGAEMGHILGYTGPITAEERTASIVKDEHGQALTDGDGDPIYAYGLSDYVGKAGLESGLEDLLRGREGKYVAKMNASNRVIGEYPDLRKPAVNGNSVVLTIPLDYQQQVIKILQEGYGGKGGINNVKPLIEEANKAALAKNPPRPDQVKPIPPPAGAAVAIDPRNGEILALVSLPGYDVRLFANGITQKEFDVLLEKDVPDKDKTYPLQNRTIASVYPPGSTLKPFSASAGLHTGKIKDSTKFKCLGNIRVPPTGNEIGGNYYWCWTRDQQHQDLSVYEALATSCDVFFYTLAGPKQPDILGVDTHFYQPNSGNPEYFNGLGIEALNDHLRLYGFGALSGIELGDEVPGLVPGTAWKEQTFVGDSWSLGDTLVTAIGQGYMQVTPLQLCNATAAIANGGTVYKPTLVHEVLNDQGQTVRGQQAQVIRKLPIDRNLLEVVRTGMKMNVEWHRDNTVKGLVAPQFDQAGNPIPGTEQFPLPPGISAGVKTGTAEYDSAFMDDDGLLLKSHAWCSAFAPYDNPEICVLAFVEGGSGSATIAAPVAAGMINAWFARKSDPNQAEQQPQIPEQDGGGA
jgi:penicillin-binding protein 2